MLFSELIDHIGAYAPSQLCVINGLSPELRAAHFDAIQGIYQSRSGDAHFSGRDRHKRLAGYVGTEAGWNRVQRLAGRIYTRNGWKKQEDARVKAEQDRKLAAVESEIKKAHDASQATLGALNRWTDRLRDAAREKATAETEITRLAREQQAARARVRELELERDLVLLG